jgi:hypothetical protein
MGSRFDAVFTTLKPVLGKYAKHMTVTSDSATEYTLVSKCASPFPQHKGKGLFFGSLRLGKAYVSFHLLPLYMNPRLTKTISPLLKKRMQGKACFNFKEDPEPAILSELGRLTEAGFREFREKKWL